jgi:predicted Ser/Thr protein kinase
VPRICTKSLTVSQGAHRFTSLILLLTRGAIFPVHNSASERDIRAAYKRLSKKYHPDKNKDLEAEGKFVQIAHGLRFFPQDFVYD